jgi:SAM-dependent methyltransferase
MLFLLLAFVTGGPFVPSKQSSVDAMVLMAGIKRGKTVYDIGSGDGRVLFAAAKKGAIAVGLEINPFLVWYTKLKAYLSPQRGLVHARWADLWKTSVADADLVFVYLIPWKMHILADKLRKELPKGATVVTNSFIFPGWKVAKKDPVYHIYTYEIDVNRS